ncbi:MAG: hypothetical protein V2I63_00825 [Pseudomonadales bacterium]|jgi:hypothetical protein|nr:hypothetical protein [Pseudomonadales bacterium]
MSEQAGPFDLDDMRLFLTTAGEAHPRPVTDDFYEALERDFATVRGGILIQRFSFDAPWGTWEMHPQGDEFVYLLDGETDLILRHPGGERALRLAIPGCYALVPRGTWHTARPLAPTTLLFVTPGDGTENRVQPPA